jgi:hypothetical protein
VYLEPEAAYAEAQRLAGEQGEGLAVSGRTLRKRLKERGLLASTDTNREMLTIRRTLGGRRREVIHLLAASLSAAEPDQSRAEPERYGRVAGRVSPDPTTDPTTKPDHNARGNAGLVGLVGSETEGEGTMPRNFAACKPRKRGTI